MKAVFILFLIYSVVVGLLSGCGLFSVESPRPDRYQLESTEKISQANIPVIVNAQIDKQRKIAEVAREAIASIDKVNNKESAEAITNIVANAISGIEYADWTAKIL